MDRVDLLPVAQGLGMGLAALRDREWLVQAWADRMLGTGPAGPVCVDLEWLGRGWADRMPVTGPTE